MFCGNKTDFQVLCNEIINGREFLLKGSTRRIQPLAELGILLLLIRRGLKPILHLISSDSSSEMVSTLLFLKMVIVCAGKSEFADMLKTC